MEQTDGKSSVTHGDTTDSPALPSDANPPAEKKFADLNTKQKLSEVMVNNSNSGLALALIIAALILAPFALNSDSWLTRNIDTDDFWGTTMTQDIHITLSDVTIETCADGTDCETESKTFETVYNNCSEEMKLDGASNSEIDQQCGLWEEFDNAGFIASNLLFVSTMSLVFALVIQGRAMLGNPSIMPSLMAASSGILIIGSIITWNSSLPEIADNLNWSTGPNQGILAGILAIGASIVPIVVSKLNMQKDADDSEESE